MFFLFRFSLFFFFFFFNDPPTTEIYTLSLHDALPIFEAVDVARGAGVLEIEVDLELLLIRILFGGLGDRKSTRLNSSHSQISYAVFCLKKKKKTKKKITKTNK